MREMKSYLMRSRPISASFLIRNSGKYHRHAGLTNAQETSICRQLDLLSMFDWCDVPLLAKLIGHIILATKQQKRQYDKKEYNNNNLCRHWTDQSLTGGPISNPQDLGVQRRRTVLHRYTFSSNIPKDCLLSGQEQCCTRITWLVVCLLGHHRAENGPIHREMVVDCALVITSKVKPFSRPDKTKKEVWMIQSVFCIYSWHWVLLTNQSTQTHYIHTNIKMKERFV